MDDEGANMVIKNVKRAKIVMKNIKKAKIRMKYVKGTGWIMREWWEHQGDKMDDERVKMVMKKCQENVMVKMVIRIRKWNRWWGSKDGN